MFPLSVVDPIRLAAISLKALPTPTRVFPARSREVTASLDFQLQHHLESVEDTRRLNVILKEVSDVICHCCYKTCTRAGGFSKSDRL
jgi:hypothetical protein